MSRLMKCSKNIAINLVVSFINNKSKKNKKIKKQNLIPKHDQ